MAKKLGENRKPTTVLEREQNNTEVDVASSWWSCGLYNKQNAQQSKRCCGLLPCLLFNAGRFVPQFYAQCFILKTVERSIKATKQLNDVARR